MSDGPLAKYRSRLAAGDLQPDPCQELAAEKLQSLHRLLTGYQPRPTVRGWRDRLGLAAAPASPPRGLYLFGGTGRGKTMLMDLFHHTVPVARRRRAHFHAFMLDVHKRIHIWRREGREHNMRNAADPIPPLADALAAQAWLLCFDEFEVLDVADALIMSRLFGALFERGVVVVATSNRAPDELYPHGLQRDRFLPFIALLKQRLDVLQLDGATDYRRQGLCHMSVYFTPLEAGARRLDAAYHKLAGDAACAPCELAINGRVLEIAAAGGIARCTFAELCETPLGAADYLAIAQQFHTVFVAGIPCLGPEKRNEAKRLATLIDVLYEHNVKLLASAEAAPDALYVHGTGTFEFRRAASRLAEMQTETYLAADHDPHGSDRVLRASG